MKDLMLRRLPVVYFHCVFSVMVIAILLLPRPVAAQGGEMDLMQARLNQLEQRQAALEEETQQLREQVASLGKTFLRGGAPAPIQLAALQTPAPAQAVASRSAVEAPPQKVQFGAEIRFRPESRSNFNSQTNMNAVMLQRVRLDARLRLNENVTGLVQLQDSRLWGQESSTTSNESNLDLHQGYLQVARFLGPQLTLRLGRQELSYGNQRLLGAFGWDNVGRSFDAGKLTFGGADWSADLFAGRLADRRNSGRGN
ncbi:MAG TPA: alginate export family protein, partial [Anaerolineales bacterium]